MKNRFGTTTASTRGTDYAGDQGAQVVAKFTPGPWCSTREHPHGSCIYIDCQPDGNSYDHEVAVVYATGAVDKKFDHARANARLIAAAPDLLAALQGNARLLRLAIPDLVGRVEGGKLAALIRCAERAETVIFEATTLAGRSPADASSESKR